MRRRQEASGTAELQGALWGARAADWAEQEPQSSPIYEEAIRRIGLGAGTRVLDVGCGSGSFCRLAADLGAQVRGLDASEALIEIARRRVPEGVFRVGDLQFLPYDGRTFDVVTGFNSIQFAGDPVAALREAGRVTKPEGTVFVVAWGDERVDLRVLMGALAPLLPPPPPASARSLSERGTLEEAAREAGLNVRESGDGTCAFEFADEETAVRTVLSSAGGVRATRHAGAEPVRAAITAALARFRGPAGGYRLENEWHYLVASV